MPNIYVNVIIFSVNTGGTWLKMSWSTFVCKILTSYLSNELDVSMSNIKEVYHLLHKTLLLNPVVIFVVFVVGC
jgi:hypothetical protein